MAFSLRYFIGLLLISLSGTSAFTQSSQASIVNTLNKQLVLLREGYANDELAFNAQGDPIGNSATDNFPLSGITIQNVRLTSSEIEIRGHRNILLFTGTHQNPQEIRYVSIDRKVHLTIAQDAAHPEALAAAVNKIFALDIQNLLAEKTPLQQETWLNSVAMFRREDSSGVPSEQNAPIPIDFKKLNGLGANVMPPKLLSYVDPQYSQEARDKKISGICPISLTVDQNGNPTHIRILQPLGMGLDENAVVAVSQYRFAPAKSNGQPISVTLHVEVNFRIFN